MPLRFPMIVSAMLLGALLGLWAVEARSMTARQVLPVVRIPDGPLDEDQRILHALNRLGYGPRPGDLGSVRERGLASWIYGQLHPEKEPESAVEERLRGLDLIDDNPAGLMTRIPPARVLRDMKRTWTESGLDFDEIAPLFPELLLENGSDSQVAGATVNSRRDPAELTIQLTQAKLIRAVFSERQLQEVMTDFWFNHFNVYMGKGATRWLTADYERTAIRPHALGRFRDMLGAVARHPAMLFYLDNWLSSAPEPEVDGTLFRMLASAHENRMELPPGGVITRILQERGVDTGEYEEWVRTRDASLPRIFRQRTPAQRARGKHKNVRKGLNENYARELLELHTLGVDAGYSQQDIIETARCFSGWTLLPIEAGLPFGFMDELHDKGPKQLLGKKISGKGIAEGRAVLDLLATHPATARFISTKLARRFVSDDPPEQLIQRMARRFLETDGQIREVLLELFQSAEFWSAEAHRAKVKTPLEYVVSLIRTTGAELGKPVVDSGSGDMMMTLMDPSADTEPGGFGLQGVLRQLGQKPYAAGPPTGYPDRASRWISTGSMLQRFKVAAAVVLNRVPGVLIPDRASFGDPADSAVLDRLARDLLGQQPSIALASSVQRQFDAPPERLRELGLPVNPARAEHVRLQLAMIWLLSAPEFQRR